MKLDEKAKNMNVCSIASLKLAVAAFVLFVITIWPAAMTWVHSVNPWYFFVAFVNNQLLHQRFARVFFVG